MVEILELMLKGRRLCCSIQTVEFKRGPYSGWRPYARKRVAEGDIAIYSRFDDSGVEEYDIAKSFDSLVEYWVKDKPERWRLVIGYIA
jgi:hypothetical protein